jgi:hypothetical protein
MILFNLEISKTQGFHWGFVINTVAMFMGVASLLIDIFGIPTLRV